MLYRPAVLASVRNKGDVEVAQHRKQPPPNQQVGMIEFVGGPFDGHRQNFAFPHEELSEVVMLPGNRNMLRMVQGMPVGPRTVASSVAVYELVERQTGPRYEYWLSASPGHLELEDWLA